MALILIGNKVSHLEEMGESLETLVVRTFSCKATGQEYAGIRLRIGEYKRQLHKEKR